MMKAIISTSDEEIAEIRNQNIIANVLDLDAIVQLKSALQEASKKAVERLYCAAATSFSVTAWI